METTNATSQIEQEKQAKLVRTDYLPEPDSCVEGTGILFSVIVRGNYNT